MSRVTIVEPHIQFKLPLQNRPFTRYFVIHHIGHIPAGLPLEKIDADRVNDWHIDRGFAGIGYHYLICADGRIERGRPRWAMGAHDEGENACSIGICVAGDFTLPSSRPNAAQMASLENLLADLCEIYRLRAVDPWVIQGHRDNEPDPARATECPGDGLYSLLPAIRTQVANLCVL